MLFETPRLIIRMLRHSDFPDFFDMQGNLKVMQYVGGTAQSREEAQKDLNQVIDIYSKSDNDFWVWAIELKSSNEFAGTCALIKNDAGDREIGYRLREKFWGKGIGTEITVGLIDYAFNQLNIKELYAEVDKKNIGSVKILDRIMVFEKEIFNKEENCIDRIYRLKNLNNNS